MAISHWAQRHSGAVTTRQLLALFLDNSLTGIVNAAPLNVADGTALALASSTFVDPCARCLVVSQTIANSTTARGFTIRIVGHNQFGDVVQEDMAFSTASAIATTTHMFTRNAYLDVTSVSRVSSGGTGTVVVGDTVSVGVTPIAGTVTGTILNPQPNGAALTQYQGVGLPIQIRGGFDPLGAANALATAEVRVVSVTDVLVTATLTYTVDAPYQVLVPNATFVVAGAGIHGMLIHCQTNAGE